MDRIDKWSGEAGNWDKWFRSKTRSNAVSFHHCVLQAAKRAARMRLVRPACQAPPCCNARLQAPCAPRRYEEMPMRAGYSAVQIYTSGNVNISERTTRDKKGMYSSEVLLDTIVPEDKVEL